MFQNINESVMDNYINSKQGQATKKVKNINIGTNIFSKKYILLYIVAFMISQVGLTGDVSPFSISIMAACFANSIPAIGVMIVSLIGNFIKYGASGSLAYMLTVLIMIATFFAIKPIYNEEERNEKIKIGKNVFIATFIVQIAKVTVSGLMIYDILVSITFSIITFVFYKIFVNSLGVLEKIHEKRAFSIEEVLGTSLLLSIAVSCFGDLGIFGFQIKNILSILIVLILGWQNGVLVGATSGVTIGVTMGVITNSEPIMIAAYAISGLVAGIFNRFGKIGVIVGFTLGNVVLAYVSNGYTVELIHFKEILIASIGLLALPKTIHIDIEEFIGNSKLLPVFPNRALNKSKEMVQNLNNVSEIIQDMAQNYKETKSLNFEDNNVKEKNKQIFITELLENLEPYKDNMLYEDITDAEGEIINKIFDLLIDKQEIDRQELLEIFAKCNSYIIEFDDVEISTYLEESISQIVRAINVSYKISKSNFILMKKIEENKKNLKVQLTGVSKVIQDMAQNIREDIEDVNIYKEKETQIIEILRQKQIQVEEITIKRKNRYFVEVYINDEQDKLELEKIEKVLTKVLDERIVFNKEASLGNRLSYISDDKYVMGIANANMTKDKSSISGDSFIQTRLKDGNYLIALSDGMGSGVDAKESSNNALRLLENLLLSGFDKNTSIDLITSSLINQNEEIFATLDVAIVDLYGGKIEFIKSGACPTYIKNRKKVQIIKSNSLPTGIINKDNIVVFDKDIMQKDIMVMCSDGILDSNVEYKNKELWIKYLLEDIETMNTKKIADLVLTEAVDNNYGIAKDDMSVIVCKFMEKE